MFKKFRESCKNNELDLLIFGFIAKNNIKIKINRNDGEPSTNIKKMKKETINRRSSPLIFKVLKVNNSYYWLVLWLAGEFLPERAVIEAEGKSIKPDYTIINKFWQELKKYGTEYLISQPKELNDENEGIVLYE